MNEVVPVYKDRDKQRPIPTAWRGVLATIVCAISKNDFGPLAAVPQVRLISDKRIKYIVDNIQDYGVHLTDLPEESWNTSVCHWMDKFWDVLVDLYSIEEGATDLVLAVRVYEEGNGYSFEVDSVYVP